MNTINRDYRLDDIVELIKQRKNITIPELMYVTGASRATLKRDLRLIKKRYQQIITKPGVAGGIFWLDEVAS